MLNMIRADFYRLRHTKSFWITLVVTALVCIFMVASGSKGSMLTINDQPVNQNTVTKIDGLTALGFATNSMVFYCILPLIVIVLGSEYSKGTLKNIITTGMSRTSFFLGKFISYTCILILEMLVLYLTTFLTGTLIGGVGEVKGDALANTIYYFCGFLFLLLAMTAVTNCLLYVTKNTVVSVISAIIVPMVIMSIHFILGKENFLQYIDLMAVMDQITMTTVHTMGDLKEPFIGAAGILVGFLGLTNYIFNKQDL